MLMTAAIALYSNETMFEAPAAQVFMEVVDDEGGQSRMVFCQFGSKRTQVPLNDRVERSLFRFMALVLVDHWHRRSRSFDVFVPA
jgi:hypothetical protein